MTKPIDPVKDAGDRLALEIEITPAMIEAGVKFLQDFYPGEWNFGRDGIASAEATLLSFGLLEAALRSASAARIGH